MMPLRDMRGLPLPGADEGARDPVGFLLPWPAADAEHAREDALDITVEDRRADARAERGEKIVVTRNGKAVACLGPLNSQHPIKYGELRGVPLAEDLSLPGAVINSFEPAQ